MDLNILLFENQMLSTSVCGQALLSINFQTDDNFDKKNNSELYKKNNQLYENS